MAHPDASGRVRAPRIAEPINSKPRVHVQCIGINAKGLPCRNSVAASRMIPLCHLHREQETISTPCQGRRQGSSLPDNKIRERSQLPPMNKSHHNTAVSPVTNKTFIAGDVYHTKILPSSQSKDSSMLNSRKSAKPRNTAQMHNHDSNAKTLDSSMMQLTSNVSALQLSTTENSSDRPVPQIENVIQIGTHVPVSRSVSHSTTMERAKTNQIHDTNIRLLSSNSLGTTRQAGPSATSRHKGPKFSVSKLLRSLGCVPVRSTSSTKVLPVSDVSDVRLKATRSEASISSFANAERLVPRKAVDFRPTAQVLQENQIKKDRADIQRIISEQNDSAPGGSLAPAMVSMKPLTRAGPVISSTPKAQVDMVGCVRSDIQPYRDPKFIKYRMTESQRRRYFLARYANETDYPHKSEKPYKKLVEVLNSIVNAAVMANFSLDEVRTTEYVYIFRLDGDYAYTPAISLKIGRSKDVDARLRQWYAQCRYKIDKLDQFQTQHAILLERMLHLEFEEDRVLKQCRCGRTHREWFDIRRDDARGRIRRAYLKWSSFADEVQALKGN